MAGGGFSPFLNTKSALRSLGNLSMSYVKSSVTLWCFTHSSVSFQINFKLEKVMISFFILALKKFLRNISTVLLRQKSLVWIQVTYVFTFFLIDEPFTFPKVKFSLKKTTFLFSSYIIHSNCYNY